jgi:hypothetical protein
MRIHVTPYRDALLETYRAHLGAGRRLGSR